MEESELIDRMARIENTLQTISGDVKELSDSYDATIKQLYTAISNIAVVDSRAKSAHHRIDDLERRICWTLGVSVTVVGIFASVLTSVLTRM